MFNFKKMIMLLAIFGADNVYASPKIELSEAENYCVVRCYIRVPFKITNDTKGKKIGRIFCDFDANVTAKLPIYRGKTKTKNIKKSVIGVFKTDDGVGVGDVEMSTGITKSYLKEAKLNKINCHL